MIEQTCMNELQSSEHLVEKELEMLCGEVVISFDNLMKIRFHELKDNVNIFEVTGWRRKQDMLNLNYIRMSKKTKKLYLSQDPYGIRDMLENVINLLYCDFLSSLSV